MAQIQPTDDEKAIMEVQDRVLMSVQNMARLTNVERSATGRKQRTELMLTELKAVPDSANTYKSVGKAYFLAPKKDLVAEAESIISEMTAEVANIQNQRSVVEQKMKEAESELKELIQTNPQLARQLANVRVSA